MCNNNCTGTCSGCNGCSEEVILSCDKSVSFVSSFTFTVHDLNECKTVQLVAEAMKIGDEGNCIVGIGNYKDDVLLSSSKPDVYEITSDELKQYNFDFLPDSNADKCEITVKCINGATLKIEHINIKRISYEVYS